ncbi:MAG: 3-deoxy-7-phosphoheptulonate synthase [Gammaproteobacteria bacterium]|nr:3-deoxy-7-phosphoheptulonate synthase [Gammaproteobacteria bacterium]
MIIILHPDTDKSDAGYRKLMEYLAGIPGITTRTHDVVGAEQTLTEVYLVGRTATLDMAQIQSFEVVERVVRVSREYRILGRHKDDVRPSHFDYNGVRFGQDNLNIFAGLCAVDTRDHVEQMMRALKERGLNCTRMGAYKPRTSPYSFQGHGRNCLPYVFELAGKYGIRVIAMEVTHEAHINEIDAVLQQTGNSTGVLLQIGTRNAQNFELLKSVGRQNTYPVLLKRGFGITLEESLNAAEYLASEGNRNVVFCLRGMKTQYGDPHRNMVDFSHVPTVKMLTRMPVCIDPSHSVGSRHAGPDRILDVFHATAQGVIAGANMILVDFHPDPARALVDGPQALRLEELDWFLEDVRIARAGYEQRQTLRDRVGNQQGI